MRSGRDVAGVGRAPSVQCGGDDGFWEPGRAVGGCGGAALDCCVAAFDTGLADCLRDALFTEAECADGLNTGAVAVNSAPFLLLAFLLYSFCCLTPTPPEPEASSFGWVCRFSSRDWSSSILNRFSGLDGSYAELKELSDPEIAAGLLCSDCLQNDCIPGTGRFE